MKQPTKQSNPKEAFGDAKVPMDLIPDTALIEENLAFLEGALKYGAYNYRVAGVKVSTYVRAARRHLAKFWNGQDRDPVTLVMELASVRACCAILIDGLIQGNITDDRPPRADLEAQMVKAVAVVAHLKELLKDHHPTQYTELLHGGPAVLDGGPFYPAVGVPAGTKPPHVCWRGPCCEGADTHLTRDPPANVGTGIAPDRIDTTRPVSVQRKTRRR